MNVNNNPSSWNFHGDIRRNSDDEAATIASIQPQGQSMASGRSRDDFHAQFESLVLNGQQRGVTPTQLGALLPSDASLEVPFPPAREMGGDEIRAGRKWMIPDSNNPQQSHKVWVHTNDPTQDPQTRAGSGASLRVQDSRGDFLSDSPLAPPPQIINQREAAQNKLDKLNNELERTQSEPTQRQLKFKAKLEKQIQTLDQQIANSGGYWGKPSESRANSQHIPFHT